MSIFFLLSSSFFHTLFLGKIAKMLLDEANDFSCATTDVLAFKMLYLTSFF
jgi:hypothetical protein